MSKKTTGQIISGEPEKIIPDSNRLEGCCDCKLMHLTFYEIVDGIIWRTSYRDDWETDKDRKKNNTVVYNRNRGK